MPINNARYCSNCGAELDLGQRFCHECGADTEAQDFAPTLQNPNAGYAGQGYVPAGGAGQQGPSSQLKVLYAMAGVALVALVGLGVMVGTGRLRLSAKASGTAAPAPAAEEAAEEEAEDSGPIVVTGSPDEAEDAEEETEPVPEETEEPAESVAVSTAHTPPTFDDASASSTISPDQYTSYYGPLNVLDGDTATAWNCYGLTNNGVGEWITLNAAEPQLVKGFTIVNGYCKREEVYWWNNRPSSLYVELSDGYTNTFNLTDSFGAEQQLDFGGPHAVTWAKFTVQSCYGGSRYKDTCISELRAY